VPFVRVGQLPWRIHVVAERAASALTVPANPAKYPLDFPWSPPGVYGNQTAGRASRTCLLSASSRRSDRRITASMIELERLDCGGYCTPDERFLVARNLTGCGPSRRWTITDTAKSTAPLIAVPALPAAEAWIAEWVEADHG
jgi:hypothetical protein